MSRRDLRLLLFVSAVALAATAVAATGLSTDLLFMTPAVMLLAPLIAGRYPGEQRLTRLLRPTRIARPALPAEATRGRAFVRVLPRGGRLIGVALAVRPPPVAPQSR